MFVVINITIYYSYTYIYKKNYKFNIGLCKFVNKIIRYYIFICNLSAHKQKSYVYLSQIIYSTII